MHTLVCVCVCWFFFVCAIWAPWWCQERSLRVATEQQEGVMTKLGMAGKWQKRDSRVSEMGKLASSKTHDVSAKNKRNTVKGLCKGDSVHLSLLLTRRNLQSKQIGTHFSQLFPLLVLNSIIFVIYYFGRLSYAKGLDMQWELQTFVDVSCMTQ